jgi:hypothetical protein
VREFGNGIWSICSTAVLILASIASILGMVLLLFTDPIKANVALGFFCVAILVILYKLLHTLNSYLKCGTENGYTTDSTYVRYSTRDGINIEYEVYKYIQCKKLLMTKIKYGYHWSGSQEPLITSDIQEVGDIVKSENGTYDSVFLKYKNPLKYNECETVHTKMILDDSDGTSKPYIESRITIPLKLLRWKVELHHKDEGYKGRAVFKRKKIGDDFNHNYEDIKTIAFDPVSKSYDHSMPWPEPGYFYRIDWEK